MAALFLGQKSKLTIKIIPKYYKKTFLSKKGKKVQFKRKSIHCCPLSFDATLQYQITKTIHHGNKYWNKPKKQTKRSI